LEKKLVWPARLGDYIEKHSSSHILTSIGFDLKYRDVEKGLQNDWSPDLEITNEVPH